jgi:thiol:disulfide interchange protein DsbC
MFKFSFALLAALLAASGCSTGSDPAAARANESAAVPSDVTPAVRGAIESAIGKMAPHARIQSLQPSPVPGLFQVVAQGQVLYISGDGRYVIEGDAYDIGTRTALNDEVMNRLRRHAVAKIAPDQMIRFAPPRPRYTVVVFTDLDCPYCRAFHANIAAINKLGIAVEYLFWPRSGLNTPSSQKAVSVWCAADRKAAFTAAKLGVDPKPAQCGNPVKRDYDLGIDLGVEGTPTIIAGNGEVIGGYADPQELLKRLQAVHAPVQGGRNG